MSEENYRSVLIQGAYQRWELRGHHLYFILNKSYKVKEIRIYANGVKDLCWIKLKNGRHTMKRIDQANPKDIIHIPSHDVVLFTFYEDLPKPYVGKYMYLEIDEDIEPMIKNVLKRVGSGQKGDLYDAYLGKEY